MIDESFATSLFLHIVVFFLLLCISFLFSISLRRALENSNPCTRSSAFASKESLLSVPTLSKKFEFEDVSSNNIVFSTEFPTEGNSIQLSSLTETSSKCQNLFGKKRIQSFTFGPLRLHNIGGFFGGIAVFLEALMKDLKPPDSFPKCDVFFKGDIYLKPPNFPLDECNHVVVIIHGEQESNTDAWAEVKRKSGSEPNTLILGNWWDTRRENFTEGPVSSMWVPFASINFAERSSNTPMDLVYKEDIKMDEIRKPVAYRQKRCETNREKFWDTLNTRLNNIGITVSSLSDCNGNLHLGRHEDIESHISNRYDDSVDVYRGFTFTVNMEHNTNDIGYITEKVVDGFLARSIPIYAGASQISTVFNNNAFLQVRFGDNEIGTVDEIIRMLQDEQSLNAIRQYDIVSEFSMRRFFSWHPSVWQKYGDQLRRDIWAEILQKCEFAPDEINSIINLGS